MAKGFFDQLPSSRGGGFWEQLPSRQGVDAIEEGLRQRRSNAIFQAARAAEKGDTQFARDILMPFGITSADEPTTRSSARATPPRVIGSAERGYSAFDPNTGQVNEILPGRGGALTDIDKARIRLAEQERNQLLRTVSDLPETHPQRPALEQQLQEIDASLNQILGGGGAEAPPEQPAVPAPRNQIFLPQEGESPEAAAQRLAEVERGFFGGGGGRIQGLDQAIPPVDAAPSSPAAQATAPADQPVFDLQPGLLEQLGANAGSRLSTVGQNVRNLPSTVGGNLREAYGNFRSNIGFPIKEQPTPAQPQQPQGGFNIQTNAATGLPEFGTEFEARSAGMQPGQTFMVFDPATQRFRPARFRN